HTTHIRAGGTGLGADASAPTRPYNPDADLLHKTTWSTCPLTERRSCSASSAVPPHLWAQPVGTRQSAEKCCGSSSLSPWCAHISWWGHFPARCTCRVSLRE